MDYQRLKDDFKSDIMTIPTLKMGIISARDLYGSGLKGFVRLTLIFLLINTLICAGLHGLDLYYPNINLSLLIMLWLCSLIPSFFIGLIVSQFILFAKLVKGQLRTEVFIKNKYFQFGLIFFGIYSVLYFIFTVTGLNHFARSTDSREFFGKGIIYHFALFSQIFSFVISLLVTFFITNMEVQRLGIGLMFEVIETFVNKIKRTPL
jgi:hypothetical protein